MKKLKCIFLIEDNILTNIYNQKVLGLMELAESIQVAENGQEALELLFGPKQIRPELIFLDINMPRMNGWEFLDEYRKLNTTDYKPVIVMVTSSPNPDDSRLAATYPEIQSFTRKPMLRQTIQEIFDKHFGT